MVKYIIGEHYYTASRYKNGLHTLDNSKYLSAEEIDLLEKMGVYQAPSGLNNNPTDQEIENDFPLNMAFYRLPTQPNRFVYLHSKYTGRANHTPDRFGNFFSHSVILKDAKPDFPAIHFFEQYNWKDKFSLQDDENFKPSIEEREIQVDISRVSKTFFHFCGFFEKGNTLEIFARVIDLIVDGKLTIKGNGITICGNKDQVRELILGVNFFLPQHIANKISFATYVNNPSRYPFQITGIIPECGSVSLDPRYYTLIDIDASSGYHAKHDYTFFLLDIIKEKSDNSYNLLKNYSKTALEEFGLTEANVQLNSPLLYFNFVKNPMNQSEHNFKNLVDSNILPQKKVELKLITSSKNPDLYLKYIEAEIKEKVPVLYLLNDKIKVYKNLYDEHFASNEVLRKQFLKQYIELFRDSLKSEEKSESSIYILLNSDCTNLSDSTWITDKLKEVNEWVNDNRLEISQILDLINELFKKYNLRNHESLIPNVMKLKSYEEIRKAVEKDNFIDGLKKYADYLNNLPVREKIKLFVLGFNNDTHFYKGRFKEFKRYILVIEKHLPENELDFWKAFFENNDSYNKEKTFEKHSLDYLKKRFISEMFIEQNEKRAWCKELHLDEYSLRWIAEYIRENTEDESIFQAFIDSFNDQVRVRNNTFWSLFTRK